MLALCACILRTMTLESILNSIDSEIARLKQARAVLSNLSTKDSAAPPRSQTSQDERRFSKENCRGATEALGETEGQRLALDKRGSEPCFSKPIVAHHEVRAGCEQFRTVSHPL